MNTTLPTRKLVETVARKVFGKKWDAACEVFEEDGSFSLVPQNADDEEKIETAMATMAASINQPVQTDAADDADGKESFTHQRATDSLPPKTPEEILAEFLALPEEEKILAFAKLHEAAAKPARKPAPNVVKVSSADKPCAVVWQIASDMKGASRKDILEACDKAGVAYYTARTQYQLYTKSLRNEAAPATPPAAPEPVTSEPATKPARKGRK